MRITVEGVNVRKHHKKPSQQNPQGGIVEQESSIHYSNVVKAEAATKAADKKKATTVKKKATAKKSPATKKATTKEVE
jgi:large subunit ribosomal protein L24